MSERSDKQFIGRRADNPRAPNWAVWQHIPNVKPYTAVALSLNIDPNKVQISSTSWMAGKRMFQENQEFKDRVFVVEQNLRRIGVQNSLGVRYSDEEPLICMDQFARWACGIGWALPTELLELCVDPAPEAAEAEHVDAPLTDEGEPTSEKFGKGGALKYWILGRYPEGIPPGTSNKEIARLFQTETRISVEERTVRRARGRK